MIPTGQFIALLIFALITSITPGPNNILLMTSGSSFGYRRSLGHLLGVSTGFPVLVFFMGLGLEQLVNIYPDSLKVLKVISLFVLMYLAWKIFRSPSLQQQSRNLPKPISFWEALAFQLVNPKGWSVALTCITLYTEDQSLPQILTICLVYFVINIPCSSLWILMGKKLSFLLSTPSREKAFKGLMSLILLGTLFGFSW